jgi:hypothetical protein
MSVPQNLVMALNNVMLFGPIATCQATTGSISTNSVLVIPALDEGSPCQFSSSMRIGTGCSQFPMSL